MNSGLRAANGAGNATMRCESGFTLVEIMIVVSIIVILAAVAIPNFVKYRRNVQAAYCIANLKQIQTAKDQWHMAGNQGTPTMDVLCGVTGYVKAEPMCPTGGTYTIGDEDTDPTCSIARTLGADGDKSAWHDLNRETAAVNGQTDGD